MTVVDKMNGPDPMWRDALNTHQTTPFNVMIGGGDQVYNDAAMFETFHFRDWISLRCDPQQMTHPFNNDIKAELEEFFLFNYMRAFGLGLFSMAVGQIPMVNMWNDHDITSGFGSYPHSFMKTHIFAGFGTLAFKYYLLFQHQCLIEETPANEPSWILGAYPGQYIKEKSRSVFLNTGGGVRLLALDCRTERSREDVLSDTSYQRIWNRVHNEVAKGSMKHLLVVSALPLAYPRLIWLQKFLTSKMADGAKSIFGKFSDKFEVDMSTIDSQWTSHTHKQERSWVVEDLQEFAAVKSVRVTILSGDVRMAAVGRFYSNPELQISKENDYRYMLNIISSSIADEPTAQIMADTLNQRNKVHEFDLRTKEDLCPAFSQDVDGKSRMNKKLFPRRNWCSIKQWQPDPEPPPTRVESPYSETTKDRRGRGRVKRSMSVSRVSASVTRLARRLSRGPPSERGSSPSSQKRMSQDSLPISIQRSSSLLSRNQSEETIRARGRSSVLSRHRNSTREFKGGWADVYNQSSMEGGLDITIHCECNPRDPSGITTPYRILVPVLDYDGPFEPSVHREKKKAWWKIKKSQKQDDKKNGEEDEEEEDEEEEEEDDDADEYENPDEAEMSDSDAEEEGTELTQQVSHTDSVNRPPSEATIGLSISSRTQSPALSKDDTRSPTMPKPLFINLDGSAESSTKSGEGDSLSRFSSASQTVHGSQNSSDSTGGLVKGDGSVKRRKKFLGVF
ncbi:hypothetical protein KEM56_006059 [Ascosphaera pollenicola]|nr:hypothetical protein KEM56_006059 [Ascosphaera pollenicola]